MIITIQPDSDDVEFIRTHWLALNLIKSFLQALGISEADRERWNDVLWAEIDTNSTIEFEEMTCYFPDTIKNQQSWKYSTLFYNSSYLLLLNGTPFWAKMIDTNAVDDLPSDLINFSCIGWPFNKLSPSFNKFNQLRALDLSLSKKLTEIASIEQIGNLTWLNFSRCYSLSVITPLQNLILLNLLDISWCHLFDIGPIKNLTQLNSLNLSGCRSLSDITPLTQLTQLSSLDLSMCKSVSDIIPLIKLYQLNSLNLSYCDSLSDITPLTQLTQLSLLDLSCCNSVSNITPLTKLTQLNSLNLSGCESLSDITPLTQLTQLSSLDLSYCDSLSDITPLTKLTQLNSLYLSRCSSMSDITLLSKLTQLITLNLSSCPLFDITPLEKFTQLNSLCLLSCNSLSDITPLANLTNLTSLYLSSCDSLSDIAPLANLTNLTSLWLSSCDSLSDIAPLANLTNLTSLWLSRCKSLTNIVPLENLKQISLINLNGCTSISNLSPIQSLQKIEKINIEGCLRLTQHPDFKQLNQIYELTSSIHPAIVTDILAHCAVSRKDGAFIEQNADSWLTELQSALKVSHPAACDLATSLAIAFPHISFKLSERLCQILQTDQLLDYRPWKNLFFGVFQHKMRLSKLQYIAKTIAASSWPRGAIGGLAAIAEQLITLADGKEWFAGWVLATSAQHESNPSFLKPVAAPWCMALHCLGENALLDQWIARFTDPDDSTALDAVFLEFGNHRLGHNDAPGAFRHAMRIRATLVRDGLLADIASHYLETQQSDQAAELLFLLSAEDKRAELSLKLADIPHFLDNRDNLHRLLAACGKNAPTIGKLLAKAGMEETVFPGDADDERQRAAEIMSSVMRLIPGFDAETAARIRHLINNN